MLDDAELKLKLDQVTNELGAAAPLAAATRRGRGRGASVESSPSVTRMRLVERDGILEVEDGSMPAPESRVRRGVTGLAPSGKTVWEKDLVRLERSQITGWLERLDEKLTPNQGLRRWHDGALQPVERPGERGRTLLVIHGTFSNTENLLGGIRASSGGDEFLAWAKRTYTEVLTFDHPTLAVSPIINARALGLLFRDSRADVDVVTHSRGGLVTRWWLEGFDRPMGSRRAVFVGSPLGGTGLAAPPNIRHSLSLLANISRAIGVVSSPFLTVLTGVFEIVSSVTSLVAKTPAVDAAVALVPGLFAQSRVGNNPELLSLRGPGVEWERRYFAIQSNFESEKVGWKFWHAFRGLGDRAKSAVVGLVFEGENDLVVDSESMVDLSRGLSIEPTQLFSFGTTDRVHHTNYFEQPETLGFIRERLDQPYVN